MAIQSDETLVTKGDLKTLYTDKILPYLGGNMMMQTGISDYYSTDEKVVGIWTDGKPLYQKTFISTMVTNGGNITQIDPTETFEYKDIKSVLCYDAKTIQESTCFHSTNNYWTIWIENHYAKGKAADASYGGKPVYITIKYTKTTDTANSAATTPGCYDLNRPDLWPTNKEIFFGNGLYGYRKIGTTDVTLNNEIDNDFGVIATKIISCGGWQYVAPSWSKSITTNWDTSFNTLVFIKSSDSHLIYATRALEGQITGTNLPYDIWVTYTK